MNAHWAVPRRKWTRRLRKLLEVSYEALLHAGLVIGELPPERCGVYIGCCGSEVHCYGLCPAPVTSGSCIGIPKSVAWLAD